MRSLAQRCCVYMWAIAGFARRTLFLQRILSVYGVGISNEWSVKRSPF